MRLSGQPITELAEILRRVPADSLVLDVKQEPAMVELLATTHNSRLGYSGTFSHRRNRLLAEALLANEIIGDRPAPLDTAKLLFDAITGGRGPLHYTGGVVFIPHRLVTRRFLTVSHRRGIEVFAWTVNRVVAIRRLVDLGVDGPCY